MTRALGTRLGPCEVIAQLAGVGMGEVWRATEIRRRRDLTLKILSVTFTPHLLEGTR